MSTLRQMIDGKLQQRSQQMLTPMRPNSVSKTGCPVLPSK